LPESPNYHQVFSIGRRLFVRSAGKSYSAPIIADGTLGEWAAEPSLISNYPDPNIVSDGGRVLVFDDNQQQVVGKPLFAPTGNAISGIMDLGEVKSIKTISWGITRNPAWSASSVFVSVATSPRSDFSEPVEVFNQAPLNILARYVKYSVQLSPVPDATDTPIITGINIGHSPHVVNPFLNGAPVGSRLFNYPNPFNPHKQRTNFVFDSSESETVEVRVFSEHGDLVYSADVEAGAGTNEFPWDGRDNAGNILYNGSYVGLVRKNAGEAKCHILIVK